MAIPISDIKDTLLQSLDAFTDAYVTCALWSSNDESDENGGEPMDRNYSACDLNLETLRRMIDDCREFQEQNADLLEKWYGHGETTEKAGHDFWLTRNGHGAGFWDRFSGKHEAYAIGKELTDKAHAYGGIDLYVGDDGEIYG